MKRPTKFTWEALSEIFMGIVAERYPTSDKVLQYLKDLGCDTLEAKIIAIGQLRDAVRSVSLTQIYRSVQHRDEVYMAIIEASEQLEDELEDQLSKEELEEE